MKISLKWLNEYVDVDDFFARPEDLAGHLTAAGLEVDEIENLASPYKNVVIGTLLEVGQHPNADRLTLCQVSTGEGVIHQIVCGAKNHKQGDRVVAALPGAILPGEFTIKKSKLRGVESAGMLCSEKELQLSDESEGIMILEEDAPIGQNFATYYGLDDILFEINVTPNRADCLSHLGLAREIGALLGREVHPPQLNLNRVSESTKKEVELKLVDEDRCPRYAGCYARNVQVGPSPQWLKQRLEKVGINSINNVVDVTNFILMDLGQPLHAFDVSQLKDKKIIIESAKEGEVFKTLDGTELTLDGSELTIRDGERAVALAGCIGGENSGVSESTTDVFIESAYFRPKAVRTTARKFGLDTDSSYRFSRGVNPEGVPFAMDRACQLLQDLCGAEVFSDPYDLYPNPIEFPSIRIKRSYVAQRLGFEVKNEDFVQWIEGIGCQIEVLDDGDAYVVTPPPYRTDIIIPEDLVEEFGRLYGYKHIPDNLPSLKDAPTEDDINYRLEELVRSSLISEGFFECFNYAFLNKMYQEKILGEPSRLQVLNLRVPTAPVPLKNPLNEDYAVMRTSLIPGLLKNIETNLNRSIHSGHLFEMGKAFDSSEGQYLEESRLALGIFGHSEGLWDKSKVPAAFRIKSAVEALLQTLKGRNWHWSTPTESRQVPAFIHPKQVSFLTYEGKTLGYIGTLHPGLAEDFKLKEDIALAEFNLDLLFQGQPRNFKYKKISKFQSAERDIAFLVPKDLPAGTLSQAIAKAAGKICRSVKVFDVFEDASLGDHRSVAFRIELQDMESTLDEEQLSKTQQKIIEQVTGQLPVKVR